MAWSGETAVVIERCHGLAGEIQIQRRGKEYEIIYNGVFLMATYNGASEKAVVREALKLVNPCEKGPLRILMGGLGVGYSLREALDWEEVGRVIVAEIEPAVIRWNREILGNVNKEALSDPRVGLVNCDFRKVLEEEAQAVMQDPARRYQLIVVDTDNGSSWLSLPSNAFFYQQGGLQLIKECLHPRGVACFWSSRREETFENQLKSWFRGVKFHTVPEKTGKAGAFYLAGKADA